MLTVPVHGDAPEKRRVRRVFMCSKQPAYFDTVDNATHAILQVSGSLIRSANE
jgi:predicted HD phosphohydrolase